MLSNRVDLSRDSFLLVRKIIVKETLKMKHEIISFKNTLGRVLAGKEKSHSFANPLILVYRFYLTEKIRL